MKKATRSKYQPNLNLFSLKHWLKIWDIYAILFLIKKELTRVLYAGPIQLQLGRLIKLISYFFNYT